LGELVVAAACADVVGSCALAPLEAARIRMVTLPGYASGLWQSLAKMAREETSGAAGGGGAAALFRGLPAVLARQLPYTVTQLVSFELLSRGAAALLQRSDVAGYAASGMTATAGKSALRFTLTLACALAAGVLSSLASQPGDALMSRVNAGGHDHRRGGGCCSVGGSAARTASVPCAAAAGGTPVAAEAAVAAATAAAPAPENLLSLLKHILCEEGVGGLFCGTSVRLLHVTAIVVVQLVVFDLVKVRIG
ncbi:unnamed protein product, partial [Phaeothamnion confervicola]